jgi:hypothetical protein
MAYAAMAYVVMAYVVMAYVVMAYVVMAYVVMAYEVMALCSYGHILTFSWPVEQKVSLRDFLHIDLHARICAATCKNKSAWM